MADKKPYSSVSNILLGDEAAPNYLEIIGDLSDDILKKMLDVIKYDPEPHRDPVRVIHHFACTGGTLISKSLQVQPNVFLLSEVDPLSQIQLTQRRAQFAPTDPILLARASIKSINDETAVRMFSSSINVLHEHLVSNGQRLVLRDHTHSHYCTGVLSDSRPTLIEMVRNISRVCSVLTVRHPVDSFLALDKNGWRHFEPFSLEEYSVRYIRFLEANQGAPIFMYEDFVENPDRVMREICEALQLPYNPDWKSLISTVKLTGDSGRSGNRIAPRPRREISEALLEQAVESQSYRNLCKKLGYEPVLD